MNEKIRMKHSNVVNKDSTQNRKENQNDNL